MKIRLPEMIRLDVSTFCQLACPSCPSSTSAFEAAVGRGFLSFADFRALIDTNPSVRTIELSNYGEILLNPELSEMLKYAHRNGVALTACNGVNLNSVYDGLLKDVVRFGLRTMSCSIDGASQETYQRYRVGGDFGQVITNVRRINAYKKFYDSPFPVLVWQFIIFGHNEHEIPAARALANKLGMKFRVKLSWDPELSPVRDAEGVRKEAGAANRQEYRELFKRDYVACCCNLLWNGPQINWDGRILGCNRNFWGDFGGNAFTDGLLAAINSNKMCYARDMLQGRMPPQQGIPCTTCDLYLGMRTTGCWLEPPRTTWGHRAMRGVYRALGLRRLQGMLGNRPGEG